MPAVIDCDECQGPMIEGKRCPHCGAAGGGHSVRNAVIVAVLAASSSMAIGCSYGLACGPGAPHSCGSECNQSTYPADAGTICSCDDGGFCSVTLPDGGTPN